MHLLYSVFKMIYVDLEDIKVELLALFDQVRLNSLILVNLFIYITLDIFWKLILRFVRKLLGNLTFQAESMVLRRNRE